MNSQTHRAQLLRAMMHSLTHVPDLSIPAHHDVLSQPYPIAEAPPLPHPWQMAAAPIEVFSPMAAGAYHSPMEVIGCIHSASDRINIRLADARGEIIARRTLQVKPGDAVFFHTYLRFETYLEQNAMLEVCERSVDDGSEINQVRLPVTITPGQRYIDLTSPTVGANVANPVLVSGYSNTFEANVIVELSYREGGYLVRQPAKGGNYGLYRDFHLTFDEVLSTPRAAFISAYELDPGSGAAIDQTRIPITLLSLDARCYS